MPASSAPDQVRIPLLARLKVGTKLMLLVLLPVGVLLGFTARRGWTRWSRRAAGRRWKARNSARSGVLEHGHAGTERVEPKA